MATHLGRIPLPLPAWAERNLVLRRMALDAIRHYPAGSVILFPEMIVGPWTRWSARVWRPTTQAARERHDTILLGAVLSNGKGRNLDVLLGLGTHPSVTAARQPIPLSEWHPWTSGSFPASWWTFGPSRVAVRRTAVLVCYEQLLIWPVAWSFLSSTPPTLMIGVSNHGWSGPGAIEPRLQADAAAALAHLFGVPLVAASNTPVHAARK